MRHCCLVAFLFLGLTTVGISQTLIKIKDKDYANIPLRLYAYDNLLSHTPTLLEEKTVSVNGELSFSLTLKEPQLVYIPIYSFHLIFYIEPNKTTTPKLPKIQKLKETFVKLKSYSGREIPLFLEENNSLNYAIAEYDKGYNSYLKNNFSTIYKKKNAKNDINNIKKPSTKPSSPYLNSYVNYKEAYLYYVSGEEGKIMKKFYIEKPLLLHNTAYVSLLKKLAKPVAEDFSQAPRYRQLYNQLISINSYNIIAKLSSGITGTSDIDFNEHFFIYILYAGLEMKTISHKVALKKLSLIAQYSNNDINKELAKSISLKFQSHFKGSVAPNFSLKATDGLTYNSSILTSNKPTLIAFIDGAVDNNTNIQTLQGLQKKYKDRFSVILFSTMKASEIVPNDWKQFVIPYYSYVLRDYRLGRFPYYVLVDKNGKISQQTWQQYLIGLEE